VRELFRVPASRGHGEGRRARPASPAGAASCRASTEQLPGPAARQAEPGRLPLASACFFERFREEVAPLRPRACTASADPAPAAAVTGPARRAGPRSCASWNGAESVSWTRVELYAAEGHRGAAPVCSSFGPRRRTTRSALDAGGPGAARRGGPPARRWSRARRFARWAGGLRGRPRARFYDRGGRVQGGPVRRRRRRASPPARGRAPRAAGRSRSNAGRAGRRRGGLAPRPSTGQRGRGAPGPRRCWEELVARAAPPRVRAGPGSTSAGLRRARRATWAGRRGRVRAAPPTRIRPYEARPATSRPTPRAPAAAAAGDEVGRKRYAARAPGARRRPWRRAQRAAAEELLGEGARRRGAGGRRGFAAAAGPPRRDVAVADLVRRLPCYIVSMLDHVSLRVVDYERAKAFYTRDPRAAGLRAPHGVPDRRRLRARHGKTVRSGSPRRTRRKPDGTSRSTSPSRDGP